MLSESRLFFVDDRRRERLSYGDLIDRIASSDEYSPYLRTESVLSFVVNFVKALIAGAPIVLLDGDLSETEVVAAIGNENLNQRSLISPRACNGWQDAVEAIKESSATISLFTSGTTGAAKRVTHQVQSFLRSVKVRESFGTDSWGLTYGSAHMAGLQVLFQALLNQNTIVNLYQYDRLEVFDALNRHRVTHLSGTPTFYRLLYPADTPNRRVRRVTVGGERSSARLYDKLRQMFPQARPANIYASTELGAILRGNGEFFTVDASQRDRIRIEDGQLFVHNSLLGHGVEPGEGGWYPTGDLVEAADSNSGEFRILGRASALINVGGYKVNPHEVEEALESHAEVQQARVSGKPNSVLGNLVIAHVVLAPDSDLTEPTIRAYLGAQLQAHKIPRMFLFVDELPTTSSGKIPRR